MTPTSSTRPTQATTATLATIAISDAPSDPATARLFNAIAHRHTERRRMSYRPVSAPLLATLVESARRFGAQVQPAPDVREAFAVRSPRPQNVRGGRPAEPRSYGSGP